MKLVENTRPASLRWVPADNLRVPALEEEEIHWTHEICEMLAAGTWPVPSAAELAEAERKILEGGE